MDNTSESPFQWNESQDSLFGQLSPIFPQIFGGQNSAAHNNEYSSPFSESSVFIEQKATFVTKNVSFLKVLYGLGAPMKEEDDGITDPNTIELKEVSVETSKVSTTYDYKKYIDPENYTEGFWEYNGVKHFGVARLNTAVGETPRDKMVLFIDRTKALGQYNLYKPYAKGSHDASYLQDNAAIQLLGMDIDGLLIILRNLNGILSENCHSYIYRQIARYIEGELNRGRVRESVFFYLDRQVLKYFNVKTLINYFHRILSSSSLYGVKEKTILNLLDGLMVHAEFNPDTFLEGLLLPRYGEISFLKLYKDMNDWGGPNNFSKIILSLLIIWRISSFSDYKNKIYEIYSPSETIAYKQQIIAGFRYDEFDFNFDSKLNIEIEGRINLAWDLDKIFEYIYAPEIKLLFHTFQPITVFEKSDRHDELSLDAAVAVPAFYLKAFDDKGAWENFEKVAWLTVDVISTYTGVGNLTKLRYLIKAGKSTSLILLRTAYGVIEVTAGVMSIGLSLIENNENQVWVSKIRSYLFWAEICTLSTDLATTKILAGQAADAKIALNEYRKTIKNREKLEEIDAFGSHLDEVSELKAAELIKTISGIKGFNKWFDSISIADFETLWKIPKAKNKICSLIRHPGGLHEWLVCSRAGTFKRWGVSMDEIKNLRTRIDEVIFKNPPGYHGGPGSTRAHNEIIDLVDSSKNFKEFKSKLITWSEHRLEGGSSSLPKDFFN